MSCCRAFAFAALALCVAAAGAAAESAGAERQALVTRGWAALRAMDCARCHGRDHDGWAAPSLIAAVRDGSRERFTHFLLEGDIARGMPGYRSQALVVAELDAIYAYLCARADGAIGAGSPLPVRSARTDARPQGRDPPIQRLLSAPGSHPTLPRRTP